MYFLLQAYYRATLLFRRALKPDLNVTLNKPKNSSTALHFGLHPNLSEILYEYEVPWVSPPSPLASTAFKSDLDMDLEIQIFASLFHRITHQPLKAVNPNQNMFPK